MVISGGGYGWKVAGWLSVWWCVGDLVVGGGGGGVGGLVICSGFVSCGMEVTGSWGWWGGGVFGCWGRCI